MRPPTSVNQAHKPTLTKSIQSSPTNHTNKQSPRTPVVNTPLTNKQTHHHNRKAINIYNRNPKYQVPCSTNNNIQATKPNELNNQIRPQPKARTPINNKQSRKHIMQTIHSVLRNPNKLAQSHNIASGIPIKPPQVNQSPPAKTQPKNKSSQPIQALKHVTNQSSVTLAVTNKTSASSKSNHPNKHPKNAQAKYHTNNSNIT